MVPKNMTLKLRESVLNTDIHNLRLLMEELKASHEAAIKTALDQLNTQFNNQVAVLGNQLEYLSNEREDVRNELDDLGAIRPAPNTFVNSKVTPSATAASTHVKERHQEDPDTTSDDGFKVVETKSSKKKQKKPLTTPTQAKKRPIKSVLAATSEENLSDAPKKKAAISSTSASGMPTPTCPWTFRSLERTCHLHRHRDQSRPQHPQPHKYF